jgi:hypothetical protein
MTRTRVGLLSPTNTRIFSTSLLQIICGTWLALQTQSTPCTRREFRRPFQRGISSRHRRAADNPDDDGPLANAARYARRVHQKGVDWRVADIDTIQDALWVDKCMNNLAVEQGQLSQVAGEDLDVKEDVVMGDAE